LFTKLPPYSLLPKVEDQGTNWDKYRKYITNNNDRNNNGTKSNPFNASLIYNDVTVDFSFSVRKLIKVIIQIESFTKLLSFFINIKCRL